MPTLHVRNVPADLYERIQQHAPAENRSLSAEVINLLRTALEETERPQARILEEIRRRRFYRPRDAAVPESVLLLREDREQ